MKKNKIHSKGYKFWLDYRLINNPPLSDEHAVTCRNIRAAGSSPVIRTARAELARGIRFLFGVSPAFRNRSFKGQSIIICVSGGRDRGSLITDEESAGLAPDGFLIKSVPACPERSRGRPGRSRGACPERSRGEGGQSIVICGADGRGALYGVFRFLELIRLGKPGREIERMENPCHPIRVLDHWDNLDGSIERGYAGGSFFFAYNRLFRDLTRIRDYCRIVASVGINGLFLNNVNVRETGARLITGAYLSGLARYARVLRLYGIRLYLSINFASPVLLSGLSSADPLDPKVRKWWKEKVKEIYGYIPDFGGFLVKADSEHTPGPYTYGRDHADGANMLAEAIAPFGGIIFWRCFVYNCTQDWRDKKTDRARSAFDTFMPLDGKFLRNVVLQIKNGPMDFQPGEPVSPLFGGMEKTNQAIELQITQEYTGQQIDLFYLGTLWSDVFGFDTYARGKGSSVGKITSGRVFGQTNHGVAGVVNTGDDPNWTGGDLAQANLYAFGRLSWDPEALPEKIASDWTRLTFGDNPKVVETITGMLLRSARIYSSYTAPLGIGWMVNPGYHYGPNVDGYEYSPWGTYHRADSKGIGIDRSVRTGTGFAGLYRKENALIYESRTDCPDELLLFFHRVDYTHVLKSGKTVIQHIYDSHFEGVEEVRNLRADWLGLAGSIDEERFNAVSKRFDEQLENAMEWRDVVNSYFYRKSGIPDEKGRIIY